MTLTLSEMWVSKTTCKQSIEHGGVILKGEAVPKYFFMVYFS